MKYITFYSLCSLFLAVPAHAFELGWTMSGPWNAAPLRAKTKGAPTFLIMPAGVIDVSGTLTFSHTFNSLQNVCGRNAEVEFRLSMKTRRPDQIEARVFPRLRKSLQEKLMGVCASSLEISPEPIFGKSREVLLPWAKALRTAIQGDVPIRMLVPPIGDATTKGPYVPAPLATALVTELDGLDLLLSSLPPGKDPYRARVVQNLKWANERAGATHKSITLIVSGTHNFYYQPAAPEEALSETFEALKSLPKGSLPHYCSGKVRFAIASDQVIMDPKQDRLLGEMEKWVKDNCLD